MKKIAIVLLALAFVSPAIFTQTATSEEKSAAEKASTVAGKIVDVTVADPAKGITAGLVTVADETGKTTTFTVKATAKILAHTLDVITLNKLKVGDKVKEGDVVLVTEAMKMQSDVRSPVSGTVKEILVYNGEIINKDDILMVIE